MTKEDAEEAGTSLWPVAKLLTSQALGSLAEAPVADAADTFEKLFNIGSLSDRDRGIINKLLPSNL